MFLSPQVGARLLVFHRKWAQITGDQWVLETLQQGLRMEFLYQPFQRLKETFVPKNGVYLSWQAVACNHTYKSLCVRLHSK